MKGGEKNIMSSTVVKTSDYDIFKGIVGNRKIYPGLVKRLTDSIRVHNMLEQNPIIVNEKMEIIDGQNRLEAAKKLGVPIWYTVVNGAGLDEIHTLNTNVQGWNTMDYLNSYIDMGKKDYKLLKEFAVHYNLSVPIAMHLLAGNTSRGINRPELYQDFREGRFEVNNLEQGDKEAKNLALLAPFTEALTWKSKGFVLAIEKVWNKVDPEAFYKKVQDRGERFRRRANIKDYLRDFEDVWNRGLKENQLRFYS